MTTSLPLDHGWELATSPDGPWQPTTVPGNWYLDGIDGHDDVWHRCSFDVPADWAGRTTRLRFDAVDYEAHVSLDGHPVGGHVGGFAPFVLDLGHLATPGAHQLVVHVRCPVDPFGTVWPHAKTTLRGVMGHHDARPGGWSERGQERSSGGIWGGVTLTSHQHVSIEAVRLATPLRGADAEIVASVVVDLFDPEPRWATVRLRFTEDAGAGPVADELWAETWLEPGRNEVAVAGVLAAPRLWWTWDQGAPHRYELRTSVELGDAADVEDHRLIGIRQIEVGDDWVWRLNGRPVFIRGMNYIGEHWLSSFTPERADTDVRLMVEANLNTARVHAHVTAPSFYDACDAAGVLVWQDLPMQWGYADNAATYRVARQMVHEIVDLHGWRPSLAYWCAHNEAPWNEPWMMDETGQFVPDQNQRMDHELAALFRRLDPSRPSLANSGAGDGHTYPGWYWGKWTVASEIPGGAFVSEYGAQAAPNLETLHTYLDEDSTIQDWSFHGFQHHEIHTNVGVNILANTLEEIVERTQHYQARQLQFATEYYRRRKRERVQGVIPFMFVDPWPCISWSVVDHLRRPKLGYHALARAMQPVLPSIEAADDTYSPDDPPVFGVWWVNDLHRSFTDAILSWRLVDVGGGCLEQAETTVQITADAARRVMVAGPFQPPPGRYRLESLLTDRDGVVLGANQWDFTMKDPDADETATGEEAAS
jgi:beta-mannosidase